MKENIRKEMKLRTARASQDLSESLENISLAGEIAFKIIDHLEFQDLTEATVELGYGSYNPGVIVQLESTSMISIWPYLAEIGNLLDLPHPDKNDYITSSRIMRSWVFYIPIDEDNLYRSVSITVRNVLDRETADCKVIEEKQEITYKKVVCDELEAEILNNA